MVTQTPSPPLSQSTEHAIARIVYCETLGDPAEAEQIARGDLDAILEHEVHGQGIYRLLLALREIEAQSPPLSQWGEYERARGVYCGIFEDPAEAEQVADSDLTAVLAHEVHGPKIHRLLLALRKIEIQSPPLSQWEEYERARGDYCATLEDPAEAEQVATGDLVAVLAHEVHGTGIHDAFIASRGRRVR